MLKVDGLGKYYPHPERPVDVFRNLSFQVETAEHVTLMGPSGEGKSTLLHLLGCLDRPSEGRYWLAGRELTRLTEEELAAVRNRHIGFIFQSSFFIDHLDLSENVALPGLYGKRLGAGACRARAKALLEEVGLGHRRHHRPAALSGGERQRAAIARALFNEPTLLLADEPTGNLDARNTRVIMQRLRSLDAAGITVVLVTHDAAVAAYADRVLDLRGGKLQERRRVSA